ncbi:MAG: prepilin-type N-terminal cleavage/methylation domain-containing protein [Clostridiaceae bacterium]
MLSNQENMQKKKKNGFTLIEIIIVLAIMAILAAIAIPSFQAARRSSSIRTDKQNGKIINDITIALLEQGKIATPASSYNISLSGTAPSNSDQEMLEKNLLSVPEGKATNGSFNVTIEPDRSVKVSIGAVQVYPNPASGIYHQ